MSNVRIHPGTKNENRHDQTLKVLPCDRIRQPDFIKTIPRRKKELVTSRQIPSRSDSNSIDILTH